MTTAAIKQVREALEFYADKRNHVQLRAHESPGRVTVPRDEGSRARAALALLSSEQPPAPDPRPHGSTVSGGAASGTPGAVDGWIDVRERLPEYGDKVLVCREQTDTVAGFEDVAHYGDREWHNDNWHRDLALDEIDWWRPLPPPPSAARAGKERVRR